MSKKKPGDFLEVRKKGINWDEVMDFCCTGGNTLESASRTFGIPVSTLSLRSRKEDWPMPHLVRRKTRDDTATSQAEMISKKAEKLREVALRASLLGLEDFASSEVPIETWKDAKIAMEIGLLAAGEQASKPVVNINFLLPPELRGDSYDAPVPVDAEVIDGDTLG